MKNLFTTIVVILALVGVADAQNPVFQHLQKVSVTVNAQASYETVRIAPGDGGNGMSSGSGVVIVKGERSFILTASHVIDNLRRTRKTLKDGIEKVFIEFDDPTIYVKLLENGREVGLIRLAAKVVNSSDKDNGHDLALLEVYKKNAFTESIKFYSKDDIPEVGSKLLHVGSLLGDMGSGSLTIGNLAAQGRLINKRVFDQGNFLAMPGSSGGGVFNEQGEYVGCLTRGASDNFNLYIPIRRIKEWAKENNTEWLFNNSPIPDFKDIPIESDK